MNEILNISLLLVLAYLIGSIPTSVWIGRIFFKTDVRKFGSGNAGATNVMRVLGPAVGVPVLIVDIFKGFAAVKIISLFHGFTPGTAHFVNIQIMSGVAAIIGHVYPVYVGFRGGKGVSTIFGVLLALSPLSTLSAAGVFLVMLFATQYASIGSISAGIAFPVFIILVFKSPFVSLRIFSLIVSVLILFTHRKNISRLIHGNENKASFLFKKKKTDMDK